VAARKRGLPKLNGSMAWAAGWRRQQDGSSCNYLKASRCISLAACLEGLRYLIVRRQAWRDGFTSHREEDGDSGREDRHREDRHRKDNTERTDTERIDTLWCTVCFLTRGVQYAPLLVCTSGPDDETRLGRFAVCSRRSAEAE
jgi:hypothetical protein